jgi:hypothetical protein
MNVIVSHACLSCGSAVIGESRALFNRTVTLFPEGMPKVWLLSRNPPSVVFLLCRGKKCRDFLNDPKLPPPQEGFSVVDSLYHRGEMGFLDGPLKETPWPIQKQTFFPDARSEQMKPFVAESKIRAYCEATDARGLRCVGPWSSAAEIEIVHHYALLFAQEESKETGVWTPYWYRDARLLGTSRVGYLIKGSESYQGALMMDTAQHNTLAWVWLTPRLRRRGIFRSIWPLLCGMHPDFKILAPLSRAMTKFLQKEDPHMKHEIVEETGRLF